jgi:hypothetical protein
MNDNIGVMLRVAYTVRVEVFTAVTMKNAVLEDIKTQFIPQRKNITSPPQSPDG